MDFQTLSDPKVATLVLFRPACALSPGVRTMTEDFTEAFGDDSMLLLGLRRESPQLCTMEMPLRGLP